MRKFSVIEIQYLQKWELFKVLLSLVYNCADIRCGCIILCFFKSEMKTFVYIKTVSQACICMYLKKENHNCCDLNVKYCSIEFTQKCEISYGQYFKRKLYILQQ